MPGELVLRLLDYSIAAAFAGVMLFWFMRRTENRLNDVAARLDAVATHLRVLSFLIADANGMDREKVRELEAMMNGGKQ